MDEYNPDVDHDADSIADADPTSSRFLPYRVINASGSSWTLTAGTAQPHESEPVASIVLTGGGVVLALLLVSTGLLVQVFGFNDYYVAGGFIFSTAPLGQTLAIAHLSSVFVGMSVPISIGLGAYLLAARWLAASRHEGDDRPTPYQLGLLMGTLSGANFLSLWNSSNYILGRGDLPGGKALGRPPMLRHAVLMLFSFLAVAYASTGVETWLGTLSEAIVYPVTANVNYGGGVEWLQYGRIVNQTLCNETADLADNKPYQCGLTQGSSGNPRATSMQILAMNGISETNVIAFTDDSSAIMVPPAAGIPGPTGYLATTLGVKSICTSVTSQCIDQSNPGPDASLLTNCPSSVNFNTSATGCDPHGTSVTGGPLGPDGAPLACDQNANSTDFRFGMEVISTAYNADSSDSGEIFVGNTGFFLHGNQGGYNIITCEMKSLNVTYHYFNGSYSMVSSSPSDLAQGQRISDGSWVGLHNVATAIDGAGLYSGSYTDAFAARLSLVTLATTVYVVEPAEVLETQYTQTYIGSRLPLAPFLLLIIITFVYCVSVAVITFKAVIASRKSPYTAFARSRLLDPSTVISTAYGPRDSGLKPTRAVHELFGHETSADRLSVIVHDETEGVQIRTTLALVPVSSVSEI
ncbi:hypothetical protein B0H11DRAFT_2292081 [Mycena galericulata]|nr:hypothetical protein B0H11DRAFT_2292081 [Mycena galericulata]